MVWTEQQHRGRTGDRALYSVWKHTFHSANKLLLKSHLTGSGVIAVGAVPEFRRQEWLCSPDSQGARPTHTSVSPLCDTGHLIKQQININRSPFYWHSHLILVLHKARGRLSTNAFLTWKRVFLILSSAGPTLISFWSWKYMMQGSWKIRKTNHPAAQ